MRIERQRTLRIPVTATQRDLLQQLAKRGVLGGTPEQVVQHFLAAALERSVDISFTLAPIAMPAIRTRKAKAKK